MRRKFLPHLFGALVFVLNGSPLRADEATVSPSSSEFAISSLFVQGTNLVFDVVIPSGLTPVVLQFRFVPAAAWQDGEIFNIPPNTSEAVLTFPKPTNDVCYFRLAATNLVANGASNNPNIQVTGALRYATMPSLGSTLASNGDAVFHFKGLVDGSDKVLITHEGAFWSHINWDWPPVPVMINGNQWNPEAENFLTTVGGLGFLPESFSLDTATLEVIQGRDVVASERAANGLIVYLDDTPGGASEYEFTLHFHPVMAQPARTGNAVKSRLRIAANIDGSDCLEITPVQATWMHKSWSWPTDVRLNDIRWSPRQTNILANAGTNTFLPAGIDLSTARIVRRTGRDLATMRAAKDALRVWFADNPNGSDHYELEISFGE